MQNHFIILSKEQRRVAVASMLSNDAGDNQQRIDAALERIEELQNRCAQIAELDETTEGQNREFDRLAREIETLTNKVRQWESLQETSNFLTETLPAKAAPNPVMNSRRNSSRLPSRGKPKGGSGSLFINNKTGQLLQAYKPDEQMSEINDGEPLFGQYCLAMAKGDVTHLPKTLQNSVNTGIDSQGGFAVPSFVASRYTDLARSKSVVMRHGAESLQLDAQEVSITKITSDPTFTWVGEGGSLGVSKPGIGATVLRTRKHGVVVPLTYEDIEDSVNSASMIESSVTNAAAIAHDAIALMGAGGSQPQGIVNNSGVNAQASIGVVTDYSEVRTGIRDILNANYNGDIEKLAWINSPSIGSVYDSLVTGLTSDKSPLPKSPWVAKLREDYTTALAANASSEYDGVIGDFSQILYGYRLGEIRVEFINAGTASDGTSTYNAVEDVLVFMRVWSRVDVVCLRPSWFSVLSGLTTS